MGDSTHEFVAWLNEYPSLLWTRVDSYITGGTKPVMSNTEHSNQLKFTISLNDKDFTDQLLIKTGDNLCITTDSQCKEIQDQVFAGKIHRRDVNINAKSELDINGYTKKLKTQSLTVQQRDFSTASVQITHDEIINLSDVLTEVFQEFTRNDLGGFCNGIYRPKYVLLTPDFELPGFTFKGTALQILKELCNRFNLAFRIVSYCEKDDTNGLNLVYQVEIWQD